MRSYLNEMTECDKYQQNVVEQRARDEEEEGDERNLGNEAASFLLRIYILSFRPHVHTQSTFSPSREQSSLCLICIWFIPFVLIRTLAAMHFVFRFRFIFALAKCVRADDKGGRTAHTKLKRNGQHRRNQRNQKQQAKRKSPISIFTHWNATSAVHSGDVSASFHVNLMSENYVFQSNSFRYDIQAATHDERNQQHQQQQQQRNTETGRPCKWGEWRKKKWKSQRERESDVEKRKKGKKSWVKTKWTVSVSNGKRTGTMKNAVMQK